MWKDLLTGLHTPTQKWSHERGVSFCLSRLWNAKWPKRKKTQNVFVNTRICPSIYARTLVDMTHSFTLILTIPAQLTSLPMTLVLTWTLKSNLNTSHSPFEVVRPKMSSLCWLECVFCSQLCCMHKNTKSQIVSINTHLNTPCTSVETADTLDVEFERAGNLWEMNCSNIRFIHRLREQWGSHTSMNACTMQENSLEMGVRVNTVNTRVNAHVAACVTCCTWHFY